jgi:ABC-type lipoprotein export system ATPase subunit
MTAALDVRDLFRVYKTGEGDAAALQGLTLSVGRGAIVTVLGPSGSGKTTLLRILAGFERPSAGEVRAFGADLRTATGRELARYRTATVGYVDQHYSRALDPALTVGDLVELRLRAGGLRREERRLRADELLETVGLLERRGARAPDLSGGEQQRVALAAAVAHEPHLLLADEPTGELDATNAKAVYDTLRELVSSTSCTAVIVSHDPVAATIADRSVRIRDGRVSEETTRASGGNELVVVGRGGWLRLPEPLLAEAGIRSRALARVEHGRVVLVPPESSASAEEHRRPRVEQEPRSPKTNETVAAVEELGKTFGAGDTERKVIDHLSVSFSAGTLQVVTGPSGSGKTTLLHLLAGLALPTTGDVRVLGTSLPDLSRSERARFRRDKIAIVTQQVGLIPFLSARENVELSLAVRGHYAPDGSTTSYFSLLGLTERSGQRAARLSAGEQLRVALVRALAADPRLLLVDEPTSRLDRANAEIVAEMLVEVARARNVAVVCATHDPVVIDRADSELRLAASPV